MENSNTCCPPPHHDTCIYHHTMENVCLAPGIFSKLWQNVAESEVDQQIGQIWRLRPSYGLQQLMICECLRQKYLPTLSSTHSLFSSHWFPPPSSVHGSGTVQGNLLNLADLVIAVFSELKPYGGGGINMHIECVWGIFTVIRLKWDNKSWRDRLCHVFGRRQHNGTGWQSGYLPAPVLTTSRVNMDMYAPVLVKLPSE